MEIKPKATVITVLLEGKGGLEENPGFRRGLPEKARGHESSLLFDKVTEGVARGVGEVETIEE